MNDSYVIDEQGNQYWSDAAGNVVVAYFRASDTYEQYSPSGEILATWSGGGNAPRTVATKNAHLVKIALIIGALVYLLEKV